METPYFRLTKDMLLAMLLATRVDNPKMVDALHDVMVLGKRPSHTADKYGITRQQLERRVSHMAGLKVAFDAYASLAGAPFGGQEEMRRNEAGNDA